MYCYNVYMHEIEMREHGDHGAGDIDVWWPGTRERGVHALIWAGNIATVLQNRQKWKTRLKKVLLQFIRIKKNANLHYFGNVPIKEGFKTPHRKKHLSNHVWHEYDKCLL